MKRQLTDRFCIGAKPRDGELQTDYFDTQVSGLALRVSESYKSWTLHYTLGGKRRRLTFGAYPSISLASARTRADEAKAAIVEGRDPRSIATETLQAFCELYQARDGAKLRTAGWRQGVLERHVYPTLGSRPIAEIRRSGLWLAHCDWSAPSPGQFAIQSHRCARHASSALCPRWRELSAP